MAKIPCLECHFLPEEDDKFLEKVGAAVEEEERQALPAADTNAIATAEETRKANQMSSAINLKTMRAKTK
ncbi:hypothetical protein V6N13_013008 [Hibiscus sabdariffa]